MKTSGVAQVTASTEVAPVTDSYPTGLLHVVMAPVNEISMNARADSAGLNGLYPKPPNTCFATAIANTLPHTAIQRGRSGGRLSASRRPVSTAEKSPMEFSRFMAMRQSASVTTDAAMQTAISHTARMPKKHTEHPAAGRSAITTSRIMELTLDLACACGELERINFI